MSINLVGSSQENLALKTLIRILHSGGADDPNENSLIGVVNIKGRLQQLESGMI